MKANGSPQTAPIKETKLSKAVEAPMATPATSKTKSTLKALLRCLSHVWGLDGMRKMDSTILMAGNICNGNDTIMTKENMIRMQSETQPLPKLMRIKVFVSSPKQK
mmetsp:Transcript_2915/g.3858  ORF Transcript_2915/g.3858 Transcript_2915/m.3858 type:complete len:106 (-) Transcript_2915:167-484(-)